LYQSQFIVVDVRSWLGYLMGHIPGALRMNRDRVLQEISKHQQIVITCRSGNLSFPVAKWLVKQGYQNVYNLQGGCIAWQKLGYPLEKGNKSL
ncbi:MAG: rhodanese-like domain-containing protein, partial [Scytonema sp. PMC 1069.18]|nr:rhodanese-like domain-containing protein [Scytonema sp. PMC 1069.18]